MRLRSKNILSTWRTNYEQSNGVNIHMYARRALLLPKCGLLASMVCSKCADADVYGECAHRVKRRCTRGESYRRSIVRRSSAAICSARRDILGLVPRRGALKILKPYRERKKKPHY